MINVMFFFFFFFCLLTVGIQQMQAILNAIVCLLAFRLLETDTSIALETHVRDIAEKKIDLSRLI